MDPPPRRVRPNLMRTVLYERYGPPDVVRLKEVGPATTRTAASAPRLPLLCAEVASFGLSIPKEEEESHEK
jgi:hypothetical protein